MRRLVLTRFGRKPQLQNSKIPSGPGILVKMVYAPINPSDYHFSLGVYGAHKTELPCGIGFEGVGIVEQGPQHMLGKPVGLFIQPQSHQFHQGTYSEYVRVPYQQTVLLDNYDDSYLQQMSQCFVNPATALALLEQAQKQENKVIMLNAAFSFLGRTLIKQASLRGITTIAIIRKTEQVPILRSLGADYILNSSDDDFMDQLKQTLEQTQCQFMVDSLGGEQASLQFDAMPPSSSMLSLGVMTNHKLTIDPRQLIFMNKNISGFHLTKWLQEQEHDSLQQNLQSILRQQVPWNVLQTVPLEQAEGIIKQYVQQQKNGKILIKMHKH